MVKASKSFNEINLDVVIKASETPYFE